MYRKSMFFVGYLLTISLLTGCASNMDKKEIKTSSGLRYVVLQAPKEGAKSPTRGKKVAVHYTGWLDKNGEKGTKFDSSVDRGMPFMFIVGVGQVIAGWDEAVLGMKVGEKRLLIIPANLAYGNRSVGNIIPANSTLLFEVELLEVA
jgi:FKBP-type peptidyl-prolyl cis-trans isomerase